MIGFFVFLATTFVAVAISSHSANQGEGPARAVGIAAIAGAVFCTVGMFYCGLAYPRRFDRELIHQTIRAGIRDMGQMPAILIGRPLREDEILPVDSVASPSEIPSVSQPMARPSRWWVWLVLVAVGSGLFLTRSIGEAVSAGDAGPQVLAILFSSTAILVTVPSSILLAIGAARNRAIRRASPNGVLVASMRTAPLEFGLAQLDGTTIDRIRYGVFWSFDRQGATLWQGAPTRARVLTIPRSNLVGIGLQEGAETVNSLTCDRLVLVVAVPGRGEIMIPFLVRPAQSPLTAARAKALRSVRTAIVRALGNTG